MSRPRDLRLIGIDLGAAWVRAAILGDDGRPALLSVGDDGDAALSAAVAFAGPPASAADAVVGGAARRQLILSPSAGVIGGKRFLGRRADDAEVRRAAAAQVSAGAGGDAFLEAGGRSWSPPELLAASLTAVSARAQAQLGGPVAAVVAVPPCFGHAARQAVRDAAFLAGLEVVRLLGDGAAALLGLAARRRRGKVAVCDLGASQFGVSIVALEAGALQVLASAGDVVGGDDFDRRIAARLAGPGDDPSDLLFVEEVRRFKHEAMDQGAAPFGADDVVRTVRRVEVDGWTRDLVDRLEDPCRAALGAAGVRPGQLSEVLVVGGAGGMPAVLRKLEGLLGGPVTRPERAAELVALGAAAYTGLIGGSEVEGEVSPLAVEASARSLALRGAGGRLTTLIPRGAPLPAHAERLCTTVRDGQADLGLDLFEEDEAGPRRLARYLIGNLPAGPAGEALVWIDVRIDADGLVGVSARPIGAAAPIPVRVVPAAGLSRADVRRLASSHRVA
jgi:molecular chaperone DnaK